MCEKIFPVHTKCTQTARSYFRIPGFIGQKIFQFTTKNSIRFSITHSVSSVVKSLRPLCAIVVQIPQPATIQSPDLTHPMLPCPHNLEKSPSPFMGEGFGVRAYKILYVRKNISSAHKMHTNRPFPLSITIALLEEKCFGLQ